MAGPVGDLVASPTPVGETLRVEGERIGAERAILLLGEGAFWVLLAIVLWPVALGYLCYRLARRQVVRGLGALPKA